MHLKKQDQGRVVTNSNALERSFEKNKVEITIDERGQKYVKKRGSWVIWREGEFSEHEADSISTTLRAWGFLGLMFLLGFSLLIWWVLQASST